ncbi:TniQ family protein [Cupriavidus necator]|uniref:TniQ family protein n=1 Tax=Cupriavidus necator TaxID=106590 RepID=UPI0039C225FA
MLIDLPPPYEDELLHNVCLRYAMQLLPEDADQVLRHLFSPKTPKCVYYPPSVALFSVSSMPHLARFLPHLVENHSLIPYLLTFQGRTRTQQLYRREGGYDYLRVLHRFAAAEFPAALRWCPQCVKEDREKHGEAYWRRAHQLYGTWTCHRHQLDLVASEDSGRDWMPNRPADFAIPKRIEKYVKPTVFRSEHSRLLHNRLFGILASPYATLAESTPHLGGVRYIHFQSKYFPRIDTLVHEFRGMWAEVLARAVGHHVFGRVPRENFPSLRLGCRKPYLRVMLEVFFRETYGIDIHDERYSRQVTWPTSAQLKFRCVSRICGHGEDHWVASYRIYSGDKNFAHVNCPCGFSFKVNISLAGCDISLKDVDRINNYGDKYADYIAMRRRDGLTLATIADELGIAKSAAKMIARRSR